MNLRRIIDFRSLLSQVNQLLLNVEDESTLLQSICDIAVKYGHLKLAFIARPNENDVFRIFKPFGYFLYGFNRRNNSFYSFL